MNKVCHLFYMWGAASLKEFRIEAGDQWKVLEPTWTLFKAAAVAASCCWLGTGLSPSFYHSHPWIRGGLYGF